MQGLRLQLRLTHQLPGGISHKRLSDSFIDALRRKDLQVDAVPPRIVIPYVCKYCVSHIDPLKHPSKMDGFGLSHDFLLQLVPVIKPPRPLFDAVSFCT